MDKKFKIVFLIFIFMIIILSFNDYIKQKVNEKNKNINNNYVLTFILSFIISLFVLLFFDCKDELIVDTSIARF